MVDVCRQIGISEATFYTWKKKYGELGASELRKLRQLEDENARLRRIVADLTLDKQILQKVVKRGSSRSVDFSDQLRTLAPDATGKRRTSCN